MQAAWLSEKNPDEITWNRLTKNYIAIVKIV